MLKTGLCAEAVRCASYMGEIRRKKSRVFVSPTQHICSYAADVLCNIRTVYILCFHLIII